MLVIKGFGDVEDVLGAAKKVGANVRFDFGDGDSLIVRNTTLGAVSDDILT